MSEFVEEDSNHVEINKFSKIIIDFTEDILNSFPEFKENLNVHLKNLISHTDNEEQESLHFVEDYCKKLYPEKFFDILYQNSELFENEGLFFLPDIDFNFIWKSDISDTTKETIWKYLQLILFTLVGDIESDQSFGDTAKLFEAINNDEFKTKLEDTIKNMHDLFDSTDSSGNDSNMEIPDADKVHEHISSMLDGKLGRLAREIAEETAEDLDLNLEGAEGIEDIYEKLFKNPSKLMGLVKNVGTKLDSKIKNGDIKENELMEEASELMKKMKDMPGMDNVEEMLGKMGMGGANLQEMMGKMGMGGGGDIKEMMKNMKGVDPKAMKGRAGKMNMNRFAEMMEKNMNDSKRREQMLEKIEKKKKQDEEKRLKEEELQNKLSPEEIEKNIRELLEMEEKESEKKESSSAKPKKKKKKKGKK